MAPAPNLSALRLGRLSNVRCRLMDWDNALEDAKGSVAEGTTTEGQVKALVNKGCCLAGAIPSDQVGRRGERQVWMFTGEAMSNDVAIVLHLGDLLRKQINGAGPSP